MDAPLDCLLELTGARATGLWIREHDELRCLGFRAVEDMPEEVRAGFAAATNVVSLEQTGLGIVKAVTTCRPTVATVDELGSNLVGSASWLVRFECRRSLAVPVISDSTGLAVAVLAISTPRLLEPEWPEWNLMIQVAHELSGGLG